MNTMMEQLLILSKPVISIRSKCYMSALLKRLSVERVGHIPAALDALTGCAEEGAFLKYRCDFFRYCRGENIKNPELIRDIDTILPGTARLIRHPIWPLLSRPISDENELIALAQLVEPGLNQYILKYDEKTQNVFLKNFYLRSVLGKKGASFLRLLDRRGLDELAALLIVIRACEIQENHVSAYTLRERVVEFFIEISPLKEFAPVISSMYTEIHSLFMSSIYFDSKNNSESYNRSSPLYKNLEHMLKTFEEFVAMDTDHDSPYSHILRGSRTSLTFGPDVLMSCNRPVKTRRLPAASIRPSDHHLHP